MASFYQHALIDSGIPYDFREGELHSFFASLIGFSFTFFAISTAFIVATAKKRILAILVGGNATILSILMFTLTDFTGIWQRMIFIISFAWLIYLFETLKIKK